MESTPSEKSTVVDTSASQSSISEIDAAEQKRLDDERWRKTMLEINGTAEVYKPGPIDMSDLDRKFQEFQDAFKNLGRLMAEKLTMAMGGYN